MSANDAADLLQVLVIICSTHNGISESELRHLIPDLTDTFSSLLCCILQEYLVVTSVAGLLVFHSEQVWEMSVYRYICW